ncbi:choline dehydrogenase-like flavoprotein [Paenarthrobacter nicotinovorans]|uniref:GMC oxidoreductase n=1 Tax=Paenarthrobacter nicotinovorans TaxID=29320 RepID=UPI00278B4CCF|nr:GMC oxidoreductase [Paenarthrobacter nicotinovorans]MDP9936763.1 choline dehydrogenase-like flavoprotein [Paenarthrobacter nicotinovorans]
MSQLAENDSMSTDVDVLIVGSGPTGAAFAREFVEAAPQSSILMVEAGPPLTDHQGSNVRNLDPEARSAAQALATSWTGQTTSDTGRADGHIAARPGTFLLQEPREGQNDQAGMPAAALAANVGGMGAHWTCACPRPGGSERISFLEDRFDEAFDKASAFLSVTTNAFPSTDTSRRLHAALSKLFDAGRPLDRRVQPMPLACKPSDQTLPEWSGVDTVLGPLAEEPDRFRIVSNTLCRELLHENDRVTGAVLVDRNTGSTRTIRAKAVLVAADALRTPQLLWASGIRPAALGKYLNDQPQIVSQLALRESVGGKGPAQASTDQRDRLTGVFWIPFHEPGFPFHTQVMQVGTTPIEMPGTPPADRPVVTWGRFTTKDIRPEDRIEFSDTEVDEFGMPKMTIHYDLSETDKGTIERAIREMTEQADGVGDFFPGSHPRLLPAGSSLHYQGSVRMGEANDGTSVCDPNSRVWGYQNLYVAGNGVIPTATACNPTPTSMALAVLAARHLAHHFTIQNSSQEAPAHPLS